MKLTTVKDLRKVLNSLDDEAIVIIASDAEINNIKPLADPKGIFAGRPDEAELEMLSQYGVKENDLITLLVPVD